MTIIIDPPSGWMYGFPKPMPDHVFESDNDVWEKWFIEQGYPEKNIKENLRHVRYWKLGED